MRGGRGINNIAELRMGIYPSAPKLATPLDESSDNETPKSSNRIGNEEKVVLCPATWVTQRNLLNFPGRPYPSLVHCTAAVRKPTVAII